MEKVSSTRIALKWGLILGVLSIAVTTVYYTLNIFNPGAAGFIVSLVLYFGVLYLAMREFKILNNDAMSFGQGVGLGTLLFFTSSILYSVYDYVYKNFIDPGIIDKQMDLIEQQYEGVMSPEIMEESLRNAENMLTSPLGSLLSIFSLTIIGLICSLIVSAIMKKDKSIFD